MGKVNESEAKAIVVKYLTNQNRPYSVNDLVANLHNEVPKALMQKTLDGLVEESKIKEKVNGKQKAYFVNQDDFPVASEADLAKLDQETAAVRQQLQNLNDQVRIMEGKIRALTSELTTAEAEKKRDQLKNETKELEAKLQMLSGQGKMIDQDTMNNAKKKQAETVKEWRKRKRMFNSVADAILEGYPHSKTKFFEEVGVETDQDTGAKMPEL
jgi:chromosome segregation ATPase